MDGNDQIIGASCKFNNNNLATTRETQQTNKNNTANGNTINNEETKLQDFKNETLSLGEGGNYWKLRYEKLLDDYNLLHMKNQNLEEKLLNVVESFERKKEELVANIEYEKSTLMADVNKLSTKLVDARIKLHDFEEKELMHAAECNAPCHKDCQNKTQQNSGNGFKDNNFINSSYDPNLV